MSKKNNDQNQVPEETKEETPEEVTEASQEKQESSQEEALQQALREQEDKYLRLLAEYDNYRKRSQKEKENAWTTARADTIKELLPVYDNLERALKQETADEAYAKGVQMTMLSGGSSVRRMRPSMGRPPAKFSILKMSSLPSPVWRKASS